MNVRIDMIIIMNYYMSRSPDSVNRIAIEGA